MREILILRRAGEILLLSSLLAAAARGDTIVLANGNELVGEIVEETETVVRIRMAFGTLEVPRSEIREIRRESGPGAILAQAEDLAASRAYGLAVELADQALAEGGADEDVRRRAAAIHLTRGRYLAGRGSFEAAERSFARALEIVPGAGAAARDLEAVRDRAIETLSALEGVRAALSAGEADRAIGTLDRLLASLPALEPEAADLLFQALVLRGDRRLAARELGPAQADFERALAVLPERSGLVESRWVASLVARVYQESIATGGYERALEDLSRADSRFPGNGLVLFAIGLAREGRGEVDQAREAYLESVRLESGREAAARDVAEAREAARKELGLTESVARPVVEDRSWTESVGGDWQELSRGRFVIRHRNPHGANRVLRGFESAFERVAREIAGGPVEWPRPCEVYLHSDAESFREATGQPEWVEGSTDVQTRGGRLVAHRIHVYLGSDDLLTSTVPHELAHAVLPAVVGYGERIPPWLGEGVAVRFEAPESRARRVRRLVRLLDEGRAPSPLEIATFRRYPAGSAEVEVFYAASYAFVDWLLTLGTWADLARVVHDASERSDDLLAVLRKVYGSKAPANEADLERAWIEHVAGM